MQSGEKDKIYQGEGPFVINFKETPDYVKFIFYFFYRMLMINLIEFI